ncbi:HD2 homeodomain mating-type protein [Pyrrhoderma noxium]|uniref:HD2 homeodomain mating-type protein n=1 Tax=Pyrrhoderma noxium TaxID=2282107 RepID=A0A286USW7_9AGAM|nr:HD2 homeodomain mating-type protein [Pyrrhoderma noxium]
MYRFSAHRPLLERSLATCPSFPKYTSTHPSAEGLFLELQQISAELFQLTATDSDTLAKSKKIKRSRSPKRDVFPSIRLDIPTPDSLVFELVRIGTPRVTAQELVEIHIKMVSELVVHHERTYHEVCLSVLNAYHSNDDGDDDSVSRSKIYSQLQHATRRLFVQRIQIWEKDLVETCRDYYSIPCNPSNILQTKDSCFKLGFIPILEKVFKLTRFPSSAVKKMLAEKSGMSVKQIRDWFQNHRNRSKESPNSDSRFPLHASKISSTESIFSTESPPHAYPTRYSPSKLREMDFTIFHSINCWPRKPSNYHMKHHDTNVDIDSLVSDFKKMRISKLSLKLKDVTKRLKSHIKRRSIRGATFPYPIPATRFPFLSVSKGAVSTLQANPTRGPCRKKSSKKSSFISASRRVPQALKLEFGDRLDISKEAWDERASVEREGMKDQSYSFTKGYAYSPTPSLSKCELYSSPILPNVSPPSLPDLSSDTQTAFDSDSLSSPNDSLVTNNNYLISDNFCPEFSLGEPFNIISAYDILPAMPKFSDSIESITVDFFSLRNSQYPIITF